MKILAIETSCDETAAAVVEDGRKILSNVVYTQIEVHKEYGGVVPEIASRYHIEKISGIVENALAESGCTIEDIDAVAATTAPGLIGALLVGLNFAKSFAFSHNKPFIPVHHLRGHIAANYLAHDQLQPPFLALVVSGGHSHIVAVEDYTSFRVIGKTKDDAAGEAFDKGARVLGLPYPGGVYMDRLAQTGNIDAIQFPKVNFADDPYDFSFSGVKTSIVNYVHQREMKGETFSAPDVAAGYMHAITSVLCEKFEAAAHEFDFDTLVVAGGVSANSMLRSKLEDMAKRCNKALFVPPLSLCGDNAAMIASQAFYEYQKGNVGTLSQNAKPSMSIEMNFM
ncbi:MAG: tRNA (adenosine(37)-N6)-threonylcarbamoyltransferase complex transferase subunit TsaD [Clostridia bacterium]|nr:tRNA (adenosine(37)-N6)-threonylcarbamoyltransferase complex transferase subunit TsaD [Clostridia bacterium]